MGATKARQLLAAANIPLLEQLVAEIMLPEHGMLYRHMLTPTEEDRQAAKRAAAHETGRGSTSSAESEHQHL